MISAKKPYTNAYILKFRRVQKKMCGDKRDINNYAKDLRIKKFAKYIFSIVLVFLSVSLMGQISNTLSSVDKLYGLSRFWQEVNYNFVYLEKIDRTMWDNRYKELLETIVNTSNDYEYYRELQRFCALLKDGHTNVYLPDSIVEFNTMFGEYRLFIENIDNKAIIVRTNLSKKDEIPIGSEIIEVNGMPTQQYIDENVAPYISASTTHVLKNQSINRLLAGLEYDTFHLKIRKPDNQTINITLTHSLTEEGEVYPGFEQRKLLDFYWVDDQIAYLSLNSFADESIVDQFVEKLPELYKAKGLIMDLRQNTGGNTTIGRSILQYLTDDEVLYGSRYTSRMHIPYFKAWGKYVDPDDVTDHEWLKKAYLSYHDKYYYEFDYTADTIELDVKRVVVPTALLIGHHTASAAEDFLVYTDNQKHMIKIGEHTNGSTGQPFHFDLPGGGSARVCTKKDTYPDGREFVGYGILPDIIIKRTLNDFLNNIDPVFDKAVETIQDKLN